MYISAVAIDFGSTNSGAARIDTFKNGELVYSTPTFCHSDGHYAKVPTWFWISPELMRKALDNYSSLTDSDFRILSRNFRSTANPNIVWGQDSLYDETSDGYIEKLEANQWIEFKRFKMLIYENKPCTFKGIEYPVDLVVKLFLRIMKIECLAIESLEMNRQISSNEVQWAITIPSIWTTENKNMMTSIAMDVFGNHIRILSEPEGPVVSERIHAGSGKLKLNKGDRSLVIDIGGGTTDICLLQDNDVNSDVKFNQLASCDGIGVGGNIIDMDFQKFMVYFFSDGLKSDEGYPYNNMTCEDRISVLYDRFIENSSFRVRMEKAWLLYKHNVADYQVPREYIQWLNKNGHKEVANRIKEFNCGDIEFDKDIFFANVFKPTFEKIYSCVRDFVNINRNLLDSVDHTMNPVKIIFAGGLSMIQTLRDGIIAEIERVLGRKLSYSLANSPLMTSGSIMDGAAYILLYRKSISRIAPYNIYDPYGNVSFASLQSEYERFNLVLKLGEINEISDKDIVNNNAVDSHVVGVPVAIKGMPLQDYKQRFTAHYEGQQNIRLEFYGADDIIIHPFNNKLCWKLGEELIPNKDGDSFEITVDFNELESSGNLHYYVLNRVTGETLENNIILKPKSV